MLRKLMVLACLATPAAAWEFSPDPICTLTSTETGAGMVVTYDAAITEYTITVTLPQGRWPDARTFGMAFAGDSPGRIQTDLFMVSPDGRSLTVTDRGFGNVLNGLQFNTRAYAVLGDVTVGFDLTGIVPAITAFRACPAINLT